MREKHRTRPAAPAMAALLAVALAASCALAGCTQGGGEETAGQDVQEEYTQAESELVGTLAANRWSNADKTATLSFDAAAGTVTCEADGGEGSGTWSFALVDLEEAEDVDYLVVSVDGQMLPAQVSWSSEQTEGGSDMSVAIFGLAGSETFFRVQASHQLSVSGTPGWVSAFGISPTDVEAALASYVSEGFPAVTAASYSGTAEVDEGNGLLMIDYTLDNANATTVTVSCSTSTGEVEQVNG